MLLTTRNRSKANQRVAESLSVATVTWQHLKSVQSRQDSFLLMPCDGLAVSSGPAVKRSATQWTSAFSSVLTSWGASYHSAVPLRLRYLSQTIHEILSSAASRQEQPARPTNNTQVRRASVQCIAVPAALNSLPADIRLWAALQFSRRNLNLLFSKFYNISGHYAIKLRSHRMRCGVASCGMLRRKWRNMQCRAAPQRSAMYPVWTDL